MPFLTGRGNHPVTMPSPLPETAAHRKSPADLAKSPSSFPPPRDPGWVVTYDVPALGVFCEAALNAKSLIHKVRPIRAAHFIRVSFAIVAVHSVLIDSHPVANCIIWRPGLAASCRPGRSSPKLSTCPPPCALLARQTQFAPSPFLECCSTG